MQDLDTQTNISVHNNTTQVVLKVRPEKKNNFDKTNKYCTKIRLAIRVHVYD